MEYEIEEYVDSTGDSPFARWISGIRDKVALSKIMARLTRATLGNFGDWKSLKGAHGVHEMREHYGQGYRIYYAVIDRKIILLLAGSTKAEQDRAIRKAAEYLEDYKRRTP